MDADAVRQIKIQLIRRVWKAIFFLWVSIVFIYRTFSNDVSGKTSRFFVTSKLILAFIKYKWLTIAYARLNVSFITGFSRICFRRIGEVMQVQETVSSRLILGCIYSHTVTRWTWSLCKSKYLVILGAFRQLVVWFANSVSSAFQCSFSGGIDPLHVLGMQPSWRTKQNKCSLLGIKIYSHVKNLIVLSSRLAAFPRTCKGSIENWHAPIKPNISPFTGIGGEDLWVWKLENYLTFLSVL